MSQRQSEPDVTQIHPAIAERKEAYLEELEHERRLSPLSLEVYRRDLQELAILLTESGDFKKALRKVFSKLKPATQMRKATIWRAFLKRYPEDFSQQAKQIILPRIPQSQPDFLTEAEAFQLESACYKEKPVFRSRALVGLLMQLGLRLNEALNLKWSDIENDWLVVTRKGSKTQRLPLNPSLKSVLSLWKNEQVRGLSEDWIFPGRHDRPLTPRAAQCLIRRLGIRAQLKKPLHPHSLRHTFATHLAAKGANLAALKELMGHSQLSTTEKYLHVTPEYLRQTLALQGKTAAP